MLAPSAPAVGEGGQMDWMALIALLQAPPLRLGAADFVAWSGMGDDDKARVLARLNEVCA